MKTILPDSMLMFSPSLQDICSSIRYLQKAYYETGTGFDAGRQQRIRAYDSLGRKGPWAEAVPYASASRRETECHWSTHKEHKPSSWSIRASFVQARAEPSRDSKANRG